MVMETRIWTGKLASKNIQILLIGLAHPSIPGPFLTKARSVLDGTTSPTLEQGTGGKTGKNLEKVENGCQDVAGFFVQNGW